jgi:hypothetical protein
MKPLKVSGPGFDRFYKGAFIQVYPSNAIWRVVEVGPDYLLVVRASRYRRVLAWIKRRLP